MEMIKIARVFSTVDESMILSMIRSAGIEAITDSTNFQRIQYGSMFSELQGTVVSVEDAYVAEGRTIVAEYIETRKALIAEKKLAEDPAPMVGARPVKKTLRGIFAALFAPATTAQAVARGYSAIPELID